MRISNIQQESSGTSGSVLADIKNPDKNEVLNVDAVLHLKESEEQYRTLIETSPDAIVMVDVDWNIHMCNRQFLKMMGFDDIEEILNSSFLSFMLKKEIKFFTKDIEHIYKEGIVKNLHYIIKNFRGKRIPVEMNASLVVDNLGKAIGIICIIRDITDRKAAETALINSELRFRSVWENSTDGMRLTDENGVIVEANKSYCDITGLSRKDLIGKYFFEVYSADTELNPGELLKSYKENFSKRLINKYSSSRFKYHNNELLELNETYSFIDFGKEVTLLLGIFHNVTEMRRAEVELRTSEKFANIGKQAAILTHEIKTPLASIKTNIDMLYNSLSLPESNQKSLKIVQKEIKRLVKLLKNVLQYSKEIELVMTPVELGRMFENLKDFMGPLMEESNTVMINKVSNFRIKGDYKNLQTVFMHLIENSIESTNGNGIIEVYSEISGNDYSIFIKDNGCGIKESEKIFQPFYTTKTTGTGLGLTIAYNILKEHHAELSLLKSEPGETIFQIKFHKDQE